MIGLKRFIFLFSALFPLYSDVPTTFMIEDKSELGSHNNWQIDSINSVSPPYEPITKPTFSSPVSDATIMWDIHFSPFAGSENLLCATKIIEKAETYFFRKAVLKNSKGSLARSFRLCELLTVWLPLNYEAMLIQHEVFGHGYRIRALRNNLAKVESYQLGVPPPYGFGGGATNYRYSSHVTSSEEMAISIGGVEATAIMANVTKYKWLTSRSIDPKESILYILCQLDLSDYISSMKTLRSHHDHHSEGHDINDYLLWLNRTYPEKHLSSSRLRSLSWINLLDPFIYYSFWSLLHYISSGKETKIPMIGIGNIGYLLSARLGLTPFGPEIFWENYLSNQGKIYYFYLKGGNHANNTYVGAGLYCPILWKWNNWELGLRSDFWRQPRLMLQPGSIFIDEINDHETLNQPLYPSSKTHRVCTGAALSLTTYYRWNHTFSFSGEFGGKTSGFLDGYSLYPAATIRLGFSASL